MIDRIALRNILAGRVLYKKEWVPADIKLRYEAQRLKLIDDGFVEYNGRWVPIDEKIKSLKLIAAASNPRKKIF